MLSNIYRGLKALVTRKIKFDIDLIPYEFETLPLKKVMNWVMTESSVYFKPGRPWGFPTIIQIEATNRCNLRCVGCPVTAGLNRPSGDMDLSIFKKIIDELSDYLLLIIFWDWGEPFLNPEAYEMIRYAHDSGVKLVSSTNGQLFSKGNQAQKVVESGLDVLVFSVDGTTQETYQRFRKSGKLDLVLEGVRRVVEEKRRQNSSTPLVNLRSIVMKHNEEELAELKELARDLKADALVLRKFHDWFNAEQHLPTDQKYQLPPYPQKNQTMALSQNPCRNLWNCPTIIQDSTVCSCFVDYKGDHPLGSISMDSFKNIWYGQAYRKLRRDFRRRWKELPLCGLCSYGFKGGDVGRDANAEVFFYPN
ncbi:MAG: radical SAM protein [Deltaproteobacteria bacterium]|nr:radical SAM protein [Deltaproteobacteria bacterium]MBW2173175.1 radical SAM protein [Deltaproteobacteria bacterium]